MKTIDRELLENAAKAVGIRLEWDGPPDKWSPMYYKGKTYHGWDPLNDDGDALRLVVKLEIDIVFQRPGVEACRSHSHPSLPSFGSVRALEHDNDPCAATRRAIVRAAAAIGEAMP